jgi:hypothetical protein
MRFRFLKLDTLNLHIRFSEIAPQAWRTPSLNAVSTSCRDPGHQPASTIKPRKARSQRSSAPAREKLSRYTAWQWRNNQGMMSLPRQSEQFLHYRVETPLVQNPAGFELHDPLRHGRFRAPHEQYGTANSQRAEKLRRYHGPRPVFAQTHDVDAAAPSLASSSFAGTKGAKAISFASSPIWCFSSPRPAHAR